jgi:aerobic carbon-monoxide dehydrogenase small subunit
MTRIALTVNGVRREADVEDRRLLADVLREDLGLTGTKLGCSHGVCGSCTVHVDGVPVRSCLSFAVQADGRAIRTVEGLARPGNELHPLQQAFWEAHGLQCGFCTPGFLMTAVRLVESGAPVDAAAARELVAGNICRCTGYDAIVDAVVRAAEALSEPAATEVAR